MTAAGGRPWPEVGKCRAALATLVSLPEKGGSSKTVTVKQREVRVTPALLNTSQPLATATEKNWEKWLIPPLSAWRAGILQA